MYTYTIAVEKLTNKRVLIAEDINHIQYVITFNESAATVKKYKLSELSSKTELKYMQTIESEKPTYSVLYNINVDTPAYSKYNKLSRLVDNIYFIEDDKSGIVLKKWSDPVDNKILLKTLKSNEELWAKVIKEK